MHHLTESIRKRYLDAMGLTQWYARGDLPDGARLLWNDESTVSVPPLADESNTSKEPENPSEVEPWSGQPPEPPVQPEEIPLQVGADQTAVATDNNVTKTRSGVVSDEPVSQVGIEFVQRWWARDGWCIIDTRAKQMPEDQQKAADRLMAALAQAVSGERKPTVAHRIDWPLFVNRSIPHDEDEARFYLSQKWRAVQQQCEVKRLILLGENTPVLLSCTPSEDNTYSWEHDGMACIQGPGTSELMHLPGEKRAFWNRLREWLGNS